MTNTHGGPGRGQGRKPKPEGRKPAKKYLRFAIEEPATRLEALALQWWETLSPKQRLEQITEDHTFQPGYAERVGME